jgi:hypothetical protein
LLVGSLLHLAVGFVEPVPRTVAAVLFLLSAGAVAGVWPRFPTSRWRVPRIWAKHGETAYAAVFGFILGVGFVTASPSPGLVAVAVGVMTLGSWNEASLVFVAFALARMTPLVAVAISAARRQGAFDLLERFGSLAVGFASVEVVVLLAAAAGFML